MRTRALVLVGALLGALLNPSPVRSAVDGSEAIATVAGGNGFGNEPNQLWHPRGIAIDGNGVIYIADFHDHRVQRVATDGTATTIASPAMGLPVNGMTALDSVAVDVGGSVYVSDSGNNVVYRIATDGTISVFAGGETSPTSPSHLIYPTGLALDLEGSLYVSDAGNHRVRKFSLDGTVRTVAGGNGAGVGREQLNFPAGLTVDGDGAIYIVDSRNYRVQKVDPDGIGTTVAGGNGAGLAANQLNLPGGAGGLAVDSEGAIYVADYYNDRVQKYATDGTISTAAGGNGNGDAPDQLSSPYDVAFDSQGSLYVVDSSNHRVQKLTAINYMTATSVDDLTRGSDFEPDDADLLRLYVTFFNRQPDLGGAKYWMTIRRQGFDLLEISAYMSDSEEFRNNYSDATDEDYVGRVYANVLGRPYDQPGYEYWLDFVRQTNEFGQNPELQILERHELAYYIGQSAEFRTANPFPRD